MSKAFAIRLPPLARAALPTTYHSGLLRPRFITKVPRQRLSTAMAPITTLSSQRKVAYVDMEQPMQPQLANEPRDAENLKLDNVNADADWNLIYDHFKSVKDLFMEGGWDEELQDDRIPPHWPLEKITLSSACERKDCTSPWITKGLVKHLVLNYPCGLDVQNLKLAELDRETFILPMEYYDWDKYSEYVEQSKKNEPDHSFEQSFPEPTKSNLEIFEIFENDARDTLFNWATSVPHLIRQLKTLSVISWNGCDLNYSPEGALRKILPHLTNLETLVLGLNNGYSRRTPVDPVFDALPPNIHTLRFRSLKSLARDCEAWVNMFDDPGFLPKLRTLSFMLDLESREGYESRENVSTGDQKQQDEVPAVTLAEAKRACEKLCQAAEQRGVIVEPFNSPWTESFTIDFDQYPVDPDWDSV